MSVKDPLDGAASGGGVSSMCEKRSLNDRISRCEDVWTLNQRVENRSVRDKHRDVTICSVSAVAHRSIRESVGYIKPYIPVNADNIKPVSARMSD